MGVQILPIGATRQTSTMMISYCGANVNVGAYQALSLNGANLGRRGAGGKRGTGVGSTWQLPFPPRPIPIYS